MSYHHQIALQQEKDLLRQQVKSFGPDKIRCHLSAVTHLVTVKRNSSLNDDDYLGILRERINGDQTNAKQEQVKVN